MASRSRKKKRRARFRNLVEKVTVKTDQGIVHSVRKKAIVAPRGKVFPDPFIPGKDPSSLYDPATDWD